MKPYPDPTSRAVADALGADGRMISVSKGDYHRAHPDHVVLFNAEVFLDDGERLWSGDVDLTEHADRLRELATLLDEDVHVLDENARRERAAGLTPAGLATCTIQPRRGFVVGQRQGGLFIDRSGAPRRRTA